MSDIDNLSIQITADAKTADGAVDSLINTLDKLVAELKGVNTQKRTLGKATQTLSSGMNTYARSASRASKSTFSLASAIGKFYANCFLVIRGIKGLWNSIESTTDYIEAFNYFNVAFGKIASEWQTDWNKYGYENANEYAESFTQRINQNLSKLSGVQIDLESGLLLESQTKNLGLNIQEITQYASQLASVTNSLGQKGETSLAISSSFTKLAGDISSLFNVDYKTVAQNLQSALIGQSRAVYKYGVDITNATLQTQAYELGLTKAVSEMTQMEKQQLRVISILEQSKVSWGDLANTIESPSNMIRQFKNNTSELGMMLGQLFVPILQSVLPILNGLSIALKRLLGDIAGFIGIKLDLDSFGQGYTDLGEDIDDLTGSIDGATEATNKFKSATIGIDQLNIISPTQETSATTPNTGGTIDLTQEILDATNEYEKVWSKAYKEMENKAQKIADAFSVAFEPVAKIFEDVAKGDWFAVGQDTSNLVAGIFDFFTNAIAEVDWREIGNNIGLFLEGINWSKVLSSVGAFIWEAINSGVDLYGSIFNAAPVETTILTSIATLKFTGLGKIISSKLLASMGGILSRLSLSEIISAFSTTVPLAGQLIGPGFAMLGSELLKKFEQLIDDVLGENASIKIGETLFLLINGIPGLVIESLMAIDTGKSTVGSKFIKVLSDLFFDFSYAKTFAESAKNFLDNAITNFMSGDFLNAGVLLIDSLVSGLLSGVSFLITPLTTIGDNIIDAIFPDASSIGELCEKTFGAITNWLQNNFAKDFQEVWSRLTFFLEGFWEGFTLIPKTAINLLIGLLNGTVQAMEDALNFVIGGINALSVDIPDWVPGAGGETLGFNIPELSFDEIPMLKTGGFPEDGLFFANRTELVGKFSNGKTAVANNAQIVSGIEQGVRNAMYEVLSNGDLGGKETIIHNHIALDGREIAQNTNKFNANNGTQIFGNQTNYNFG